MQLGSTVYIYIYVHNTHLVYTRVEYMQTDVNSYRKKGDRAIEVIWVRLWVQKAGLPGLVN